MKNVNWNQLRDRVFDLILNKKVFDVFVTEDFNVFGFKAKMIEDDMYGFFINEFWLTDDEIREKYEKHFNHARNPKIVDLPVYDWNILSIQIPHKYWEEYETFEKEILIPLEKKLEEMDLGCVDEFNVAPWTEEDNEKIYREYGFDGDDIMDYAITSTICPSCYEDNLCEDEVMNPISRKDNKTYICNQCAVREAMEELALMDKGELDIIGGE